MTYMLKPSRKPKFVFVAPQLMPHEELCTDLLAGRPCICEWAQPYIRMSKIGKREIVKSPKVQLDEIELLAKVRKFRLREPICDIDKSGRSFEKRSVGRMIEEIKEGQYKYVLLWKWSRWSRDAMLAITYLQIVKEAGGQVLSAAEDFDQQTTTGRSLMFFTMNQDEEVLNVMAKTWQGIFNLRRKEGLPHSGRARFGYDYLDVIAESGEKVKMYLPNEWAPHLAEAYDKYLNGTSINQLVRDFNAAGAVTAFGGTWTPQGLIRMLDTGFAAGLIRERSTRTEAPSNNISTYDVWRAGSQQPLISRTTWDAYKAKRMAGEGTAPRLGREIHALSQMLFCAVCRRRMVTKYAGQGKSHMWVCAYQRQFHPEVSVMVNNRLALDAFREWLRVETGDALPVQDYIDKRRAQRAAEERKRQGDHAKLVAEKLACQAEIEKLLDLVQDVTGYSKQRTVERLNGLEADLERLESELQRTEVAIRQLPPKSQKELKALDAAWEDLMSEPARMRDVLSKAVSRVEVMPRGASSTRKSASDRVFPVGAWEAPELEVWLSSRSM